ncbi:MAG: crotonase/enoyl-CoA hydratase family protein [Actinobacteria bacterium]|nr:crotonase/enoyl-CoA hydratase family protein [Actinomycetota bacterium]
MADPQAPHLLVERQGHVLVATMNRPDAKNALSVEMLDLMEQTWDEVNANSDIRCAVLTGVGGTFCAGMDLKAMAERPPGDAIRDGEGGFDPARIKPLLKGFLLDKPLIAAVEGAAVAGGTEILQGTDIRVAGESAYFGVTEARLGLFPLGGSAVRLRRQIPYTLAAEILLTGRHVSAAEAKEIGLIGHVVPDGQALDQALELAALVAANGPVAVRKILQTLRDTECLREDDAFAIESKLGIEVFLSEDAREGPTAFKEKRPPEFTGR